MLDKHRNSNQEERKLLVLRYINLFGLDSIDCMATERIYLIDLSIR